MKQKFYGTIVAIFIFIVFLIFANIAKVIAQEESLAANLIYMIILIIAVIIIRFSWKKITAVKDTE
jgi:Na+/H+ antiporter NhaC